MVLVVTIPDDVTWAILLAVPVFLLLVLTAAGLGFLAAVLQVYFRDFRNLLPYLLRLGLYLTPILYFAEDVPEKMKFVTTLNPLGPVFQAWSDTIVKGTVPDAGVWGLSLMWAVLFFVAGALIYASREREFAVRL